MTRTPADADRVIIGQFGEGRSPPQDSRPTDHPDVTEMSAAEKIKVVDSNGDGVLTAKEHAQGAVTMFARMDADTDGLLTAKEIAAGHARMMTKRNL